MQTHALRDNNENMRIRYRTSQLEETRERVCACVRVGVGVGKCIVGRGGWVGLKPCHVIPCSATASAFWDVRTLSPLPAAPPI